MNSQTISKYLFLLGILVIAITTIVLAWQAHWAFGASLTGFIMLSLAIAIPENNTLGKELACESSL